MQNLATASSSPPQSVLCCCAILAPAARQDLSLLKQAELNARVECFLVDQVRESMDNHWLAFVDLLWIDNHRHGQSLDPRLLIRSGTPLLRALWDLELSILKA